MTRPVEPGSRARPRSNPAKSNCPACRLRASEAAADSSHAGPECPARIHRHKRGDRRMTVRTMLRGWKTALVALAIVVSAPPAARAIGIEDVVDGGNTYPWVRVELPGTLCSNGSQYRFWYYDSPTSTNMLIMFEGGGACWDYPSCSGQTGILGAANPNGIPTDYITQFKAKYVSPLVNGAD